MGVLSACKPVYHGHSGLKGHTSRSDPLELELPTVASHPVNAGNRTLGTVWKKSQWSEPLRHVSSPQRTTLDPSIAPLLVPTAPEGPFLRPRWKRRGLLGEKGNSSSRCLSGSGFVGAHQSLLRLAVLFLLPPLFPPILAGLTISCPSGKLAYYLLHRPQLFSQP